MDTNPQGSTVKVGAAGGTVEIKLDPSNPDSRQYAAGTTGVTLAAFNFLATTTEDVALDTIFFTQRVSSTASSASASFRDYARLYVTDEQGNTLGTVVPTSTKPFITVNSGAFVTHTNDTAGRILTLKADLNPIGPAQLVNYGGQYLGFNITDQVDVVVKGALTGVAGIKYLSTSEPPNGKTHYMYMGYPTFEKLALSDRLSASADIYKFKVTANGGDIGLFKFTLDISTTTAKLLTVQVYDVTTAGNEVLLYDNSGGSGFASPATLDVQFDSANPTGLDGGKEVIVSRSQPRTFTVKATFSGVATGASVSTRIAGDSALEIVPGFISGTDIRVMASSGAVNTDTNNDFIWSDRHVSGHSTTTADWANGFLVSGLGSASSTAQVLTL